MGSAADRWWGPVFLYGRTYTLGRREAGNRDMAKDSLIHKAILFLVEGPYIEICIQVVCTIYITKLGTNNLSAPT